MLTLLKLFLSPVDVSAAQCLATAVTLTSIHFTFFNSEFLVQCAALVPLVLRAAVLLLAYCVSNCEFLLRHETCLLRNFQNNIRQWRTWNFMSRINFEKNSLYCCIFSKHPSVLLRTKLTPGNLPFIRSGGQQKVDFLRSVVRWRLFVSVVFLSQSNSEGIIIFSGRNSAGVRSHCRVIRIRLLLGSYPSPNISHVYWVSSVSL